jgi:hypothetical protein
MVHTDFWQDPKVGEELSPEDKYFFLYLLTNPSTTQIGIYQITRRQMAFDLGYSIETVNNLLERFMHHLDMVRYNPETRELAIKSWGRYNLKRAGKPMMDCVCNELEKVKDKTLIAYVGERIHHETFKELFLSWGDEKEAAQEEWKLEVEEEGEQPEKDEIQKLFDHFVSKKIILHKKMNQAMKRAIKLSLKDYTYEELKHAIDNYATVYFSDAHWFTHKYALADFMRDKDIRKFLDEADPIQNFANKQNPQIKKPKEIRKEDFDLS